MTTVKGAYPTAATMGQGGAGAGLIRSSTSAVKCTTTPRIGQPGTSVFREVQERVTAKDAARHFGMEFDRRGWCRCPFHGDTHASMSFRAGRFRCWACGASGDSIDFTGRLLGLDALGAVERLNSDFMLGLPLYRQRTPAERREAAQAARRRREVAEGHKRFEEWRTAFIAKLNAAYRVGHQALNRVECPEDFSGLSELECIAVQLMPYVEDLSDTLSHGPSEEQAEIYRGRRRTEKWIEALLKNS